MPSCANQPPRCGFSPWPLIMVLPVQLYATWLYWPSRVALDGPGTWPEIVHGEVLGSHAKPPGKIGLPRCIRSVKHRRDGWCSCPRSHAPHFRAWYLGKSMVGKYSVLSASSSLHTTEYVQELLCVLYSPTDLATPFRLPFFSSLCRLGALRSAPLQTTLLYHGKVFGGTAAQTGISSTRDLPR